jgi:hypothetical protein
MHHILETLSTEQLTKLFNEIGNVLMARGKAATTPATTKRTKEFKVGQYVKFSDKYGKEHTIQVTRINAKTVSGIEAGGGRWRVSPTYITEVL